MDGAAQYAGMDETDRKIIGLLGEDARRSLADIGGSVGLSPSAVNERIRRLVQSGVIRRFTVEIDPAALDAGVLAYVWVALHADADEAAFRAFVKAHPQVLEAHHVTGAWSYLLKLRVPTLAHVEPLLTELKQAGFYARSETVLSLASVVDTTIPKQPGG